jgi:ribonuclease-3
MKAHLLRRAPSNLEKKAGYVFKNPELLETALTHRSKSNNPFESYERLEFLGDAVLQLIISEYLYKNHPEKSEGDLTLMRSVLVNGDSLYQVGMELNLQEHCIVDKSLDISHLPTRKKLISSLVESLMGAIYLDRGIEPVRSFVNIWILKGKEEFVNTDAFNYKGQLFEICQKRGGDLPTFSTEKITGPDHNRTYEISVYIKNKRMGTGSGYSKKSAEQNAAKEAILKISPKEGKSIK